MNSSAYWVEKLNLQPHPEGGFYRETYRAAGKISSHALPLPFLGNRNFSTAIYFLLRTQDRSLFHRIQSDELWHFYAGSALAIYVLKNGELTINKLGPNVENDESFQIVIPANCWFGAKVLSKNSYTLSGCTVSPGFDFRDFEIANRQELLSEFPHHKEIIEMLTA